LISCVVKMYSAGSSATKWNPSNALVSVSGIVNAVSFSPPLIQHCAISLAGSESQ
jgi:hypothetical protein